MFGDDLFSEEEDFEVEEGFQLGEAEEVDQEEIQSQKNEKIKELLNAARENAKIKLETALRRNIMFVGRSRVGKTTVINVMKDPTHMVKDMNIFADTMEPRVYSFSVEIEAKSEKLQNKLHEVMMRDLKVETEEFERRNKGANTGEKPKITVPDVVEKVNFCINVIDTPGLFERHSIGETHRGDEMLKKTILECLNKQIAFIHAIFLVCSVKSGLSEQDVESFEKFLEIFSGAESVIAVLFTRTENFKAQEKDKIIEELRAYKKFGPFLEKVGDRIFFTGAATFEDFDNELDQTMNVTINSVSKMRNTLLEFIFLKTKPVSVQNFKIMKFYAAQTIKYMDQLDEQLKAYGKETSDQNKYIIASEIDKLITSLAEFNNFIPYNSFQRQQKLNETLSKHLKNRRQVF